MNKKVKIKKPFYKRIWFIALVLIIVVAAIGGGTDKEEKDVVKNPVVEAPKVEKKVVTDPIVNEVDNESLEMASLAIMREKMSGVGDIKFIKESKAFSVTPTDPSFMTGVMSAVDGNKESLEAWNMVVDSFSGMSSSLSESLPGYAVTLTNPDNIENFILVIKDGTVLYDAVND